MRTEREMMDLILAYAKGDKRIRLVGMEGSRVNKNIPNDNFQDYDVSYLVTDIESFKKSDAWLNYFGKRIIMQKPEDMELFKPELGNWFSYLMLFEDGNRIDLTLIPIQELDKYIQSDKLLTVIYDKDQIITKNIVPTDIDYWIKKPTAKKFNDCCNEFWWVSTYVVKGLCRSEILYAIEHLNNHVKSMLLTMIGWQVGIETNFSLSVGKSNKFLDKYISQDLWMNLLKTYESSSIDKIWTNLFLCYDIFRSISKWVSNELDYLYPDYDCNITKYTNYCYNNIYLKNKNRVVYEEK